MVSLAKLLLNFILEKRYVLIEMPLVLFKIATQIHFIYHVQAQTIRVAPNFEGSAINFFTYFIPNPNRTS